MQNMMIRVIKLWPGRRRQLAAVCTADQQINQLAQLAARHPGLGLTHSRLIRRRQLESGRPHVFLAASAV
jgi:hypothetical protein